MNEMTVRRKLAIATWGPPREGNIYGKLTLDATNVLLWLEHIRETTGEKVTITHFVGRVIGEALGEAPSLNGYLRFNRYIPHDSVSLAYLVALEEGANLAKAKVENINKKTVAEIAAELRQLATRLREGKDEEFNKSQNPLKLMPVWLIRRVVWLTGLLTSSLGLSVKALGLEAFPFGACIVTSVGMFGLDEGYAPHTPFARVPVLVVIGAMRDAPLVVDGAIVIRPQLTITATIDHRFMDGYQGGVLARVVRKGFAEPWTLEGHQSPPASIADRVV
jgi:pyruvate/2-oxoglutarate dehydrogenase complex dihydrolipoamide acyltransferase (E2) component